jgi:hypothetical protein
VTDKQIARQQWQDQMKLIRKSERRLSRVMARAYKAGLGRWLSAGVPVIPQDAKAAIVAELARMWFDAGNLGGRMSIDADKGAYPALQTKQEELSLFERLMLEFIQRFGAVKVQQILDTTRDQLVRIIDRGTRQGLGQDAIAKLITDAIPSLSRTRARVIARTEVHSAAMYASEATAKTSPFPMNKRWISVYDARTRDFGEGDGQADYANHRAMHEVTVGPDELFAMPRSFRVGGGFDIMVGPGDPSAPGYQSINCRCALIYRRVGRPWPKEGE